MQSNWSATIFDSSSCYDLRKMYVKIPWPLHKVGLIQEKILEVYLLRPGLNWLCISLDQSSIFEIFYRCVLTWSNHTDLLENPLMNSYQCSALVYECKYGPWLLSTIFTLVTLFLLVTYLWNTSLVLTCFNGILALVWPAIGRTSFGPSFCSSMIFFFHINACRLLLPWKDLTVQPIVLTLLCWSLNGVKGIITFLLSEVQWKGQCPNGEVTKGFVVPLSIILYGWGPLLDSFTQLDPGCFCECPVLRCWSTTLPSILVLTFWVCFSYLFSRAPLLFFGGHPFSQLEALLALH